MVLVEDDGVLGLELVAPVLEGDEGRLVLFGVPGFDDDLAFAGVDVGVAVVDLGFVGVFFLLDGVSGFDLALTGVRLGDAAGDSAFGLALGFGDAAGA